MKILKVLLPLIIIVVAGAVIFFLLYVGKYNNLVNLQERTNEGKSKFAAAINTCSQKMKSVWALADQEGILEKETYVGVAKARTVYEATQKELEKAEGDKSTSILDLTKLGTDFGKALINVRVAFEAYPQLRTTETYQKAMAAVEEGFNEIKTALDDWITLCKDYNQYRKSLITNWFAAQFAWDFPKQMTYYEGGITELEKAKVTSEELNPRIKPENK